MIMMMLSPRSDIAEVVPVGVSVGVRIVVSVEVHVVVFVGIPIIAVVTAAATETVAVTTGIFTMGFGTIIPSGWVPWSVVMTMLDPRRPHQDTKTGAIDGIVLTGLGTTPINHTMAGVASVSHLIIE